VSEDHISTRITTKAGQINNLCCGELYTDKTGYFWSAHGVATQTHAAHCQNGCLCHEAMQIYILAWMSLLLLNAVRLCWYHDVSERYCQACVVSESGNSRNRHTHNRLTALCPGLPVLEEAFIHSHPFLSSNILCQLPPSILSIASSLFSLRAWHFFYNLFSRSSGSGMETSTLYYIHFFTQLLSSFHTHTPV